MAEMKKFICSKCNTTIEVPYGTPKPEKCPNCSCEGVYIHRADENCGRGMGRGRGAGNCGHGRRNMNI